MSSTTATATATVKHLVLTGGPCAGKTTALTFLREQLTRRGWRVFVVPEAATLVISSGSLDVGAIAAADPATFEVLQRIFVDTQRALHRTWDDLARHVVTAPTGTEQQVEKVVVLHDRGLCDNAAYVDAQRWADVLAHHDLTTAAAHALYDGVIHLRSAALTSTGGDSYDGQAYTRANNTARRENATEAADLDARTLAAWVTHPHLVVVDPSSDFDAKLDQTLAAALGALGDPEPVEIERKFLLLDPPPLEVLEAAAAARVEISQTYLHSPTDADGGSGEQRVRRRVVDGTPTYTHTVKRSRSAATRVEVERPISEETYQTLLGLRAPGTREIAKTRWLLVHGRHRLEVDQFHTPAGVWVVEVELQHADDQVSLPAWLGVVRDVTDEPSWGNRALATAR